MNDIEQTKTFEAMMAALKADANAQAKKAYIQDLGNVLVGWLRDNGYQLEFKPPATARKPRGRPPKPKTKKSKVGLMPRVGTNMAHVLEAVRKHPGNRGYQVQALLAQSGHVVNERTIRTALRRLKRRELIEMHTDGGWYPKN